MFTQVELLSAGSYGRLGIPLNLMTMFVIFETWQLNSEEKPILSNVSNNIPPLPPADLRLVTDLINRYNNNQLQSNCQFRNLPDDDGWSSQKVVLHSANGPWYLIQKANVSVPPIITVSFDIKLVDLSSNLLKPKFIELINELISKDITPTYRECGDLPETLNINLPSIDDAGSSISTTTQTTIGNNIQNTIINSLKKSNIPTDGIVFTIAPNTVPFPSIIITSP